LSDAVEAPTGSSSAGGSDVVNLVSAKTVLERLPVLTASA
jgi:hypothetical protein